MERKGNQILNIGVRKYKVEDAVHLHEAIMESVPELSVWLPWCTKKYSMKDAEQFAISSVESWDEGLEYRFVIEDLDSSTFLGTVGINQIIKQHKVGNLGYWVRSSATNKGVCTEAALLAVRFAFEKLDFNRIEIHILPDNKLSNAVASKLGVFEGKLRNKLFHDGMAKSANCYSIVPSDYQ